MNAIALKPRRPSAGPVILKPKTLDRWHDLRQEDVTATESAMLFGLSPYGTRWKLYHEKINPGLVEREETELMRWGKRLQRAIAEGVCQDQGWTIVEKHPRLYVRHASGLRMGCSPDCLIECPTRGRGVLEIKNVNAFAYRDQWEKVEDDTVAPPHIEIQVQHQLECLELEWGAIGTLVGGNKGEVAIRERDREVGQGLIRAIEDFWDSVERRAEPAIDYLADDETIRRLYGYAEPAKVLDCATIAGQPPHPLAARLDELCRAYDAARLDEKEAGEDKTRARNEIIVLLDDHERALLDRWTVGAATNAKGTRSLSVKPRKEKTSG
jgi:putative phage-type endonuclease